MSNPDPRRCISIGECMVELARGPDSRFGLSYGGDTFNTAVYMARAGLNVAYATALGDDPYSDAILELAARESIATDLVAILPGRMPGLYLIETTERGERTFHYWRDRAPARELFEGERAQALATAIGACRLVYISGITLSLYSTAGLDALAGCLAKARDGGSLVAMDGNYRPRGWNGQIDRARQTMSRFWGMADIALPTFDDEAALWGDKTPAETIQRLGRLGAGEIVVKLGPQGALIGETGSSPQAVPVPEAISAIDTTAAGDSFNAAYLAARLAGKSPGQAAQSGHRLAGVVICHRGAIAPAAATAAVVERASGGRT